MAARVVTAFCHGAFFGIGAVVAADLVPGDKRAQGDRADVRGADLANVLGVPGGTALGQAFGWRADLLAAWRRSALSAVRRIGAVACRARS